MANTALIFDTLRYTKKLIEVGFSEAQAELQAEAQAEAINEIVDEKLATKVDLEKIKSELKLEMELIKKEIKGLENRLLIRLGGLMLGGIALLQYLK